jgi:hypothetical protein
LEKQAVNLVLRRQVLQGLRNFGREILQSVELAAPMIEGIEGVFLQALSLDFFQARQLCGNAFVQVDFVGSRIEYHLWRSRRI